MNADEIIKSLIDRIAELQQIFDKALDENKSVTPPDSLSRLCTTLITNSIQDISAACAFIKGLTAQLAASQHRAQDARNELCLKCGRYHEAHNGACDGCRWNENSDGFEALLERLGNGDSDNAVCAMAITALREQAERSKGCEWCKALSFNPDIGGCQLVFFKSKKHPKGEHAISVSVFDEYGEEQEPVLVQIDNCIRCGKRLEGES